MVAFEVYPHMTFEELKADLQETLILTQKTERFCAEELPSISEMKRRRELHQAKMAEIERRGQESRARLRESYNRLMGHKGDQQPPAAQS